MATTALPSASAVRLPVRGDTTNHKKLHMAARRTPNSIPQRSRIFAKVGFFAGVADSPGRLVRSAPQCGQISVAWLISYSHSRQLTIVKSRQKLKTTVKISLALKQAGLKSPGFACRM